MRAGRPQRTLTDGTWYDWAMTDDQPPRRWATVSGGISGEEYAARFEERARRGEDVHGEASFVSRYAGPGGRVLDAGCGTGRVGIRLRETGHEVVGTDVDPSMLAVARRQAPDVPWHLADLATIGPGDLDGADGFDVVVLAGNVVPLFEPGTLGQALRSLAGLLATGGRLVAGFGLDAAHLPPGCPVTPLEEYDAACAAAGLRLEERFATWDAAPFAEDSGYAVSVHTG